ncbi:MAG: hypothetical protein U0T75_05095 [Chitinophagales bacterium]
MLIMEILDDQPIEKPVYNTRLLQYTIAIYCSFITLGCLWIWRADMAYGFGRGLAFWIMAAVYFVIWKQFKWNVTAGVFVYLALQTLILLGQIS